MKKRITFLATLLLLSAFADATGKRNRPAWKCYSGGSDDGKLNITKAKTVSVDEIPNFFPKELWGDPWNGKKVTSYVVGKYRGREVYCFTFTHALQPDEPEWTFDYALLASDVAVGKGPRKVRVFFLEMGEQVRNFVAGPITTGRNLTRFEIGQEIDGNGVMGNEWILDLRPSGPWLRKATFSGRKIPTVTYHYNRTGRIISTEKVAYEE